jgi:hypothetical protein
MTLFSREAARRARWNWLTSQGASDPSSAAPGAKLSILRDMTAYWRVGRYSGTGSLLDGTGGGRDAAFPGGVNDPTRLLESGYIWFPGTTGNNLSLPRPVASVDYTVTYTDDTTAVVTEVTADPVIFGNDDSNFVGKKVKSIQVRNNSGGAVVATIVAADLTSPFLLTGYVDSLDNTWTPNRTTTGLKLEVINSPRFGFGGAHYMEVADHADFQPGFGPFTFAMLVRVYNATPPAVEIIAAKRTSSSTAAGGLPGFTLGRGTTNNLFARFTDGTTLVTPNSGATALAQGRDVLATLARQDGVARLYADADLIATADVSAVGSIDNTEALRFGRLSGAGTSYGNFTGSAWAWLKGEALTGPDLTELKAALLS